MSEKKSFHLNHNYFMELALKEAEKAFAADEVPVGAVLIGQEENVLSSAFNQTISLHDPTAHAEISALRIAGQKIKNYRFVNTTLYVTVEPCIMCMGAIIHSRVSHVVFGTPDPKWGAAGSLYAFQDDLRLNHQPRITEGICKKKCRQLMVDFFKQKRL
jgi:tRNA(adenine34) deaminase